MHRHGAQLALAVSWRPFLRTSYSFICRDVHGASCFDRIPHGIAPMEAYNHLVSSGSIRFDQHQVEALRPLDRLHRELKDYVPPTLSSSSTKVFSLSRIFSSFQSAKKPVPRGVYIYGGVGNGKSLVADIFYHCSPVKKKRRVHFHQFMLDVHRRLHETRLNELMKRDDAVKTVAEDLLNAGWLLCFDEFQVIDIADALILRRLLEVLYKLGAVIVTSSNRAPNELYKNGLQRDLFLPCIESIKRNCEIHAFNPTCIDYRLISSPPDSKRWSTYRACCIETRFKGDPRLWIRLLVVPKAAGGVAYFDFVDLCGLPKGASDYIAIAASFHTLFIANIPQLTSSHNEMARRFITLVDVLYEQRVKLVVSASVDPRDLYMTSIEKEILKGENSLYEEKDEEFAFNRTVSRLIHMQSSDYLSASWASCSKDLLCHLEKSRLQIGDLRRIWDRYNLDADAKLSRSELMMMMEDLMEIKCGHRNVPEELLDDCLVNSMQMEMEILSG